MPDNPVLCKNHSPIILPFVPATWLLEVPKFFHEGTRDGDVWHTYLCDACLPASEQMWSTKGYTVIKTKL